MITSAKDYQDRLNKTIKIQRPDNDFLDFEFIYKENHGFIDLNKRKIYLPPNMDIVAMQGETEAESIHFITHKYFDRQMLFGNDDPADDCKFVMQMRNAAGDIHAKQLEPYVIEEDESLIGLKWTIDYPVTCESGTVVFSLVIFKTEKTENNKNRASYVLITKESSFEVYPAKILLNRCSIMPAGNMDTNYNELVSKVEKVLEALEGLEIEHEKDITELKETIEKIPKIEWTVYEGEHLAQAPGTLIIGGI